MNTWSVLIRTEPFRPWFLYSMGVSEIMGDGVARFGLFYYRYPYTHLSSTYYIEYRSMERFNVTHLLIDCC